MTETLRLVSLPLDAEAATVEVAATEVARSGMEQAGIGSTSFEEALRRTLPVAISALKAAKDVLPSPARIEVEFGIGFSVEGGVFIAKGGASANFSFKLTFENGAQ